MTHLARETSLASCLAARDNRLPVPLEGESRPCCCSERVCVCVCECEERGGTMSPGAVQQWDDCSLSLLPSASPCFAKHQKCYLKVLLWPIPAPRGHSLNKPVALNSFRAVAHNSDRGDTLYSKDTQFSAQNDVQQITDSPRVSQKKKKCLILHDGAQNQPKYNDLFNYNNFLKATMCNFSFCWSFIYLLVCVC